MAQDLHSGHSARAVTITTIFSACSGAGSNWPDAQAIDEDVDQPENAGLPTRLIMHVAHAHKRTQDVFRADVVADLAGRDRPVQQARRPASADRTNRRTVPSLAVASAIAADMPFFVATNSHSSAAIDAALRRAAPPASTVRPDRQAAAPRGGRPLRTGLRAWEMPVKRADADTGGARDGFEARFRATGAENRFCRLEDTLAIANGIGARLSLLLPIASCVRTSIGGLKNGGTLRISGGEHADT